MRSMANDLQKNWYSVLGAAPTDDLQELKQKYQRLVLMFHPDKQKPGLSEEEADLRLQRFIDVDQAWKVLSNEESRRKFDLQLRAHELKQSWPVDACVTVEDMNWDSENECYSHSCRCGGEFHLEKEEAEEEDSVVCCDTCSLSIEGICGVTSLEEGHGLIKTSNGVIRLFAKIRPLTEEAA